MSWQVTRNHRGARQAWHPYDFPSGVPCTPCTPQVYATDRQYKLYEVQCIYINIRHLINIRHVCLSWTRMTLLSSNLPEFFDPIYTPPSIYGNGVSMDRRTQKGPTHGHKIVNNFTNIQYFSINFFLSNCHELSCHELSCHELSVTNCLVTNCLVTNCLYPITNISVSFWSTL